MGKRLPPFRAAVNGADRKARDRLVRRIRKRDRLVRRIRKLRADAVLDKNTFEHWNRMHPNDPPISTEFFDAVIAWCDGRGPMPVLQPEPNDG